MRISVSRIEPDYDGILAGEWGNRGSPLLKNLDLG